MAKNTYPETIKGRAQKYRDNREKREFYKRLFCSDLISTLEVNPERKALCVLCTKIAPARSFEKIFPYKAHGFEGGEWLHIGLCGCKDEG